MLPVVVVHGGAGHVPRDRSDMSISGVCSAARAAYGILRGGGNSMDAVVEAVIQMENNPTFNAGKTKTNHINQVQLHMSVTVLLSVQQRAVECNGQTAVKYEILCPQVQHSIKYFSGCGSVLNVKGEVEMDALVMDGKTLASGAVSAVRNIANPIQLARLVMDKVQTYLE